jgi:hypothetical protein
MNDNETLGSSASEMYQIKDSFQKNVAENSTIIKEFGKTIQRLGMLTPTTCEPEDAKTEESTGHLSELRKLANNLRRQNNDFSYLLENLKRMI